MKRRHLVPLATAGVIAVTGLLPLAATAHADSTAPMMTNLGYLKTDHGYVLKATASGDVARIDIRATPNWLGTHDHDTVFSLTQPQADGSYQTTSPLNLAPGYYDITAYAYAPDGTRSYMMILGGNGMPFVDQPDFHDTAITPGQLSMTTPTVTATGRLTTYDPNKGDAGSPWTAPITVDLTNDWTGIAAQTHQLGADGTFHLSLNPQPFEGHATQTISVMAEVIDPHFGVPDLFPGEATDIAVAPPVPTRVVLDPSGPGTPTAGTTATVSGTLQYEDATGWHPVSGARIFLGQPGNYTPTNAPTDANGRFAFHLTVPNAPTTWRFYTLGGWHNPYLGDSDATDAITAVDQALTLRLSGASVDAHSNLTFHQSVASTNSTFPGGHVLLQQSADGRTGWTTIATLPATTSSHTLHVTNPHGYWRLYSPAAPGYTAATSNTIHTFRYLTNITGGTPNTTHAHHGQTLTFTGHLWEQGMSGWSHFAHAKATLLFRPAGSTTWHTVTSTETSVGGSFTLHTTATKTGTWAVVFTTPDNNHTNACGPLTYIHIS